MSVVMRMEMPKCCDDCDANYDCMACGITGTRWYGSEEFNPSDGRLPDCPILCQLPEKHGQLVDAEKLKEQSVHFCETEYTFDFDAVFIEDINEAPVIVPAERGEI